jgi:hypothetical protein
MSPTQRFNHIARQHGDKNGGWAAGFMWAAVESNNGEARPDLVSQIPPGYRD